MKSIDIIAASEKGDEKAISHINNFMDLMGICFANIFTVFDPHVVVLGGGLSNFDLIYQELPKRIIKHSIIGAKVPKIIKAKHGDSSGVRGAAFLNLK